MLLWGTAAPVIKIGFDLFKIEEFEIYSKILFAGLRFIVGGALMLLILSIKERHFVFLKKRNVFDVISIGLVQTTLQFILFYIGISHTTSMRASVFSALTTFFAVAIAHFFYKDDRLNFKKVCGCIIGFLGIVVLSLGNSQGETAKFSAIGDILVILSMFSNSVATIMSKEASKRGNITAVTGYSLMFGGLILLLIGTLGNGAIENVSLSGIISVLYLGFLTAIALALYNILLKYNSVSLINMYNFLVPVFGAIFSAILLGEDVLTFKNMISLLLACSGILIVNLPDRIKFRDGTS